MAKKKIIIDKEKSEKKKVFHTPTAPPTKWHKDKKRYNRKQKHKKDHGEE